METKNLGLVKAIFIQSTSPVRTDVWWYDTLNSLLKYWDVGLLQWKEVTGGGGGGGSVTYTQISIPANSNLDVVIGLTSVIRGLILEYVGERGSLYVEGVGRCLISGTSPYTVTTDEQGDSMGVEYEVIESGSNLALRILVDNSSSDIYNFSYRIETKPKF
jgi:hypothetical protein